MQQKNHTTVICLELIALIIVAIILLILSVSINKKSDKLLPSYPLLFELFLLVSCVKCLC